jgi:dTMP kinase
VPFVSGLIGPHSVHLTNHVEYRIDGTNAVLLIAAVVSILVGFVAYRQMDDTRGTPLWRELYASIRGVPLGGDVPTLEAGVLIAFEGGEGAGKSTQARLLAIWLRDQGYDVVTTQEPGATKIGMRLRAILLDKNHAGLSPRAETLMYEADRAEHVEAVIRPALARGAVVITDRYIDSTLAYQGAGRDLPVDELGQLNAFATGGLVPDLTILLDLPPEVGLGRHGSPADRLESEPKAFHDRVRRGFRGLAELAPERYMVIDAARPLDDLTRELRDRVRSLLPDPVPSTSEDVTHTFPAIRD